MGRNVLGSALAVLGAAAAVFSSFRAWYNGREGQDFRLADLFTPTGITSHDADLFTSLFLPFLVAAVLTLIGVVLRSRPTVAVAGLIVLLFTILWMVREGLAQGGLTVESDGSGLDVGVAAAFGGGVLLLIGALVMQGRRRRPRGRHVRGYSEPAPPPPDAGGPPGSGSV